jgi:hypothetical protein
MWHLFLIISSYPEPAKHQRQFKQISWETRGIVLSLLVRIYIQRAELGECIIKANIPAEEKYVKSKPRLSSVLKSPYKITCSGSCDGTIVPSLE